MVATQWYELQIRMSLFLRLEDVNYFSTEDYNCNGVLRTIDNDNNVEEVQLAAPSILGYIWSLPLRDSRTPPYIGHIGSMGIPIDIDNNFDSHQYSEHLFSACIEFPLRAHLLLTNLSSWIPSPARVVCLLLSPLPPHVCLQLTKS